LNFSGMERKFASSTVRLPSFDQDSPSQSCEQWLIAYLEENGPTRPAQVVAAGEKAGFSRPTIYRVRKQLQGIIRNTNPSFKAPDNTWRLAEDEEDETDDHSESLFEKTL
jgi:hypothetical protein